VVIHWLIIPKKILFNIFKEEWQKRENPTDLDGLYNFHGMTGNAFNYTSGELKAYIDLRDGNGNSLIRKPKIYLREFRTIWIDIIPL
jgi:hypothetical protein